MQNSQSDIVNGIPERNAAEAAVLMQEANILPADCDIGEEYRKNVKEEGKR